MSLSDTEIRRKLASVAVWYHRIPIRPDIITPGIYNPEQILGMLGLPEDCRGMRVLDIGTRDGYFAFEMERRGAEVLAVDYLPSEESGFKVVSEIIGSKVAFLLENIYNLSPSKIGKFDIVLFLGILYHLPDPIEALKIVRSLCRDRMYLEAHTIDHGVLLPNGKSVPLKKLSPLLADIPIMQFYPGNSLNSDPTNYWGANLKCLKAMLRDCKFNTLSHRFDGNRAVLQCEVIEDPELDYIHRIARGLNPKG